MGNILKCCTDVDLDEKEIKKKESKKNKDIFFLENKNKKEKKKLGLPIQNLIEGENGQEQEPKKQIAQEQEYEKEKEKEKEMIKEEEKDTMEVMEEQKEKKAKEKSGKNLWKKLNFLNPMANPQSSTFSSSVFFSSSSSSSASPSPSPSFFASFPLRNKNKKQKKSWNNNFNPNDPTTIRNSSKTKNNTYSHCMHDFQFFMADFEEMTADNQLHHYYLNSKSISIVEEKKKQPPNPRARLKAIQQNLSLLEGGFLPLDDFGTGIYVCAHENDPSYLKAIITGPRDTPYAFGLFEFDIYLPPDFPEKPPHVWFKTTNSNTIRFNPNLYSNGKVCLSLLGTWSGPSWDPKISSLHQVLNSIQSYIFVEHPYFNEPGIEESSAASQKEAKAYVKAVREATLRYGVLQHLKSQQEYEQQQQQLLLLHANKTGTTERESETERETETGTEIVKDGNESKQDTNKNKGAVPLSSSLSLSSSSTVSSSSTSSSGGGTSSSPLFNNIIKYHFQHWKKEILQLAQEWVNDAPKKNERHYFSAEIGLGNKSNMEDVYRQLKKHLKN